MPPRKPGGSTWMLRPRWKRSDWEFGSSTTSLPRHPKTCALPARATDVPIEPAVEGIRIPKYIRRARASVWRSRHQGNAAVDAGIAAEFRVVPRYRCVFDDGDPERALALLDEALTRIRWLKNKVFFSLLIRSSSAILQVRPTMSMATQSLRNPLTRLHESRKRSFAGQRLAIKRSSKNCGIPGTNAAKQIGTVMMRISCGSENLRRVHMRLVESLPLGFPKPSIGSEPDGQLTLEWYKSPRRSLSVSVDPDGLLHYAGLYSASKRYGSLARSSQSAPSELIQLVREPVDMLDPALHARCRH